MKCMFTALLLVTLVVIFPATAQEPVCESGFRLFDHEYSGIEALCIPENPQRIVVLDEGTMTDLIALGVKPMAVHDWGNRDYAQYLVLDPSTIESAGTPDGPNYEVMLRLDADLIIGKASNIEWFGENALENLQTIAPTALSSVEDNARWYDHLRFLGSVLGKEAEAEALVESYETRLQEFREAYQATGKDETIAIIRSRADSFSVYAKDSFISETVKSAGLKMPDALYELEAYGSISLEEIRLLTSDYLFVMARNERESQAFVEAREGPLWQFLPAVQNNQLYQVNWSVWVAGWNVVGAHLVIDDLFYYLLDGASSPTPNPLQNIIIEGYSPEYDAKRFAN
jgi:iron complex transport system substrate-binding protein